MGVPFTPILKTVYVHGLYFIRITL